MINIVDTDIEVISVDEENPLVKVYHRSLKYGKLLTSKEESAGIDNLQDKCCKKFSLKKASEPPHVFVACNCIPEAYYGDPVFKETYPNRKEFCLFHNQLGWPSFPFDQRVMNRIQLRLRITDHGWRRTLAMEVGKQRRGLGAFSRMFKGILSSDAGECQVVTWQCPAVTKMLE